MRYIRLSGGAVVWVDDCDYTYLSDHNWKEDKHRHTTYAGRTKWYKAEDGSNHSRQERMHRVIMQRIQPMPITGKSLVVDHIDGNGLNNTRANLRWATRAENSRNIHHTSKWRNANGL